MKLEEKSMRWSLSHLIKFNDTDLFPKPMEFDVFEQMIDTSVARFKDIDLGNYTYGPSRRFIVPKNETAYRTATQLDPQDSVFLTAILYEFGKHIERRRIPVSSQTIFSYRFSPTSDLRLYDPNVSWREYWQRCREHAKQHSHVVCVDIADFYNQIYHHVVENQLESCALPNQIQKWIMGLLESVTVKVSRGIPIGPHATHLLAELALIPIDNSIKMKGLSFCRYSDDIAIFCGSYQESRIILYTMAETLDKQQRLVMQQQKIRIYESEEFIVHCDQMLQDRPINQEEKQILDILRKYTDDPYTQLSMNDLSEEELEAFSISKVDDIMSLYLHSEQPNYARIRWLLRRLSQVGIPSAVEFCIEHIGELTPAISDLCHYLIAAGNNYEGNWARLGRAIFAILQDKLIMSNEYLQLALLSLFARNPELNQIDKLLSIYKSSPSSLKREILLCAYMFHLGDWIRELKENYSGLDPWSKRALIIACKTLPIDERKFFLNHIRDGNELNNLLSEWAKASYR